MFDVPSLSVPHFARLSEYFGVWAIETSAFLGQWAFAASTDLFAHVAAAPVPRPATQMAMVPGKGDKNVAVIGISGTLMKQQPSMGGTSTIQLRRDVRAAANDPSVSGILLAIDSPGGTVSGTADLAAEVRAARKKKPIWSHVQDLGASAAYWVASQTDQIFANTDTALIGSIGTVQTVYDLSAAAERDGVKTLVFRTGPLKGLGTPGDPVTEEQAGHLQQIVNEMQTHFDSAVKSGRNLSAGQLAAVRTGGVFTAADAMDKRLIDGIRSFDSTLSALSAAK